MTPIDGRQLDRFIAILLVGGLVYAIYVIFLLDSRDNSYDPDALAAAVALGLLASAFGIWAAARRIHLAWHKGKIAMLIGSALLVTIFSPVHSIGFPLLMTAGAFTWIWLPERR